MVGDDVGRDLLEPAEQLGQPVHRQLLGQAGEPAQVGEPDPQPHGGEVLRAGGRDLEVPAR